MVLLAECTHFLQQLPIYSHMYKQIFHQDNPPLYSLKLYINIILTIQWLTKHTQSYH